MNSTQIKPDFHPYSTNLLIIIIQFLFSNRKPELPFLKYFFFCFYSYPPTILFSFIQFKKRRMHFYGHVSFPLFLTCVNLAMSLIIAGTKNNNDWLMDFFLCQDFALYF